MENQFEQEILRKNNSFNVVFVENSKNSSSLSFPKFKNILTGQISGKVSKNKSYKKFIPDILLTKDSTHF